jgi:hypothetical protein
MLRLTAALVLLTATTAGAASAGESLESRIHAAAVEACAPLAVPEATGSGAVFHYGAISARCVDRISKSAMAKYQALAEAKRRASTAANN